MDKEQTVYFPAEFLNSLNPPEMPPHMLNLKVGSPLMLLRNLDLPKLCNGTRPCKLMANAIEATSLTGNNKGESVLFPAFLLSQVRCRLYLNAFNFQFVLLSQ
ncbi:hypothetical protein AVEN_114970-1 [Araneus ventricosus]|uniref:DNA helicase Pif1-like 2B domain-containing protein n=1 Tax=Araneus ventricosus TaxID=182803 RepID=A0A4Y2D892_ARAVE|nr:hypothetical protein AVEN_114970-1 [Araneus ventricosus]